ncbi:HAD-IA family hydrolase [Pseudidiomarina sp.]|uniref:HAD-IA family hydrolase n=1 Tax=Pseudidiomarina sp. TaxID=2081707 RepID=UPI00299D0B5C|nr:HAD-IA family hydrolase [Pseudidiomarina sp.]MDX1705886.1 HAD-IA family hydrolase [Pseudidiomarina sp.]
MQFFRRLQPVQVLSFDLDDTLYPNAPVMRAAEQAVHSYLCERHPQVAHWTAEDWARRRLHMMGRDQDLASDMTALRLATLSEGFREAGIGNVEAAAEAAMQEFLKHRNAVEMEASTRHNLERLAAHYPLFALSNGNVSVDAIGLSDYFTGIFQPRKGRRGKPHPDMFDEARQLLPDIPPSGWLHIGDSPTADVLGACRAGWQTAWFTGGLGVSGQLHVLPSLAFDDFSRLTDFLLKDKEQG